jgi:uncharacterized protein YjiS (DUF1127 family)
MRSLRAMTGLITRQLLRLDCALRNRQAMRVLARMDDRLLADIGLTRADVQDAFAQSLWRDPGNLLRARALERRLARLGISHGFDMTHGFAMKRPPGPPLAPEVDDMVIAQAREAFCNRK